MTPIELARSKAITARIYYGADSDEYARRKEAAEAMARLTSRPSRAIVGRIYISGPMSGMPDFNRAAFHLAWNELHAQGYEAINPGNIEGDDDWTWSDWMREDIKWLVDCQNIVMLPGWEKSRGAKLEKYIAQELGMRVYFWLDGELRDTQP